MSRLFACLLVVSGLLVAGAAQAQRRHNQGQALIARPSKARYSRSPVLRDYFRSSRRPHYQYAPSYRAYYHRRPYQTHLYVHRPLGRTPVASLRPRKLAGSRFSR